MKKTASELKKLLVKLLISITINIAAALLAYLFLFVMDFSFFAEKANYPVRFGYAVPAQLLITIYSAAVWLHSQICKKVMPFTKKKNTVLYLILCLLLINPYIYYGIVFCGILGTSMPRSTVFI